MRNWIQAQLLKGMRVPPEPDPPDGTPDSIRIFRAGENYYRLRLVWWALAHLPVLIGLIGFSLLVNAPKFGRLPGWAQFGWHAAAVLALAAFLMIMAVSYFHQRLNFDLRWYIVTDRSLRIRSGVWSMQELTMTFANIQDLRVTAGPLQGFFKLADLEVRSAGGGAGPHGGESSQHTAYFEGVDNAEELRELLLERLRHYRDAGLGEASQAVTDNPQSAEAAALAVLQEVRALKNALVS